ncbi:NAD(P)H-dependent oxidoreductase [Chthonobacter rhizosphaerae]|uniref:NAD(P)H-dependent oxidoreductase n=1 Tax=Chthonobacter rhizosphaerae TaxID=2735553 RepID=UPI0015EEBCE6|nr:NAD(P)H-dependent oxidoreductase [Chthonobacter rhizosphaerae]
MRVLVIHAHPVETSYNAALHAAVVKSLALAGHQVDDLNLYAETFDPVLSREERIGYHDIPSNRAGVGPYVDRLLAAEALVLVYPVWNYGLPAILKGFVDRVFLPGVSFVMRDGKVAPTLTNIRKLAVVTTYGGTRWRAILAGDPPRKIAERVFRVTMGFPALTYLAHYDMNRSTDASRAAFLAKVRRSMERF